jgi:hypothetical protein
LSFPIVLPKLKSLFVDMKPERLSALMDANPGNLPAIEVVGCRFVLTPESTGAFLEARTKLRLLSYDKNTLWSIAVASPTWESDLSYLNDIRAAFPGQISLAIDATNPDTGTNAMYYALKAPGNLRGKVISRLIELGADPTQRIPGRVDHLYALHNGRPMSLLLCCLRQDSAELIFFDSILPKYEEKYAAHSARQWIDDEPVHPLAVAFSASRKNLLLMRMLKVWKWDLFLPLDDPVDTTICNSVPACAPLILCCLRSGSVKCSMEFLKSMKDDAELIQKLVETLHQPAPLDGGGCWLFWMAHAPAKVFDELLNLPGINKDVLDGEGLSLIHRVAMAEQRPMNLEFPPRVYLEALESSSKQAATVAMKSLLAEEEEGTFIPAFIRRLQLSFIAGEHSLSLFEFLKKYHFRIHFKNLALLMRLLPEKFDPAVLLASLPLSITPDELESLARTVATSPKVYERWISLSLRVLKDAGSRWLDSSEFVDLLWTTWPKEMLQFSGVFAIPSCSLIPSSVSVSVSEVVSLVPAVRRPQAVWQLMQNPEIKMDDKWYHAFSTMFSAGFTQPPLEFARSPFNPTERQVFSKFLTSLTCIPEKFLLNHLVDAINRYISPFVLKEGLSHYPHFREVNPAPGAKLWGAIFDIDGEVHDLYAGQVADVLIEANLDDQSRGANLNIVADASPTALRKYLAFHRSKFVRSFGFCQYLSRSDYLYLAALRV